MKMRQSCFAMTLIVAACTMAAEPGPARTPAGRSILLNEAADALVSMLRLPAAPKETISAEQAVAGLRAKVDQYADTKSVAPVSERVLSKGLLCEPGLGKLLGLRRSRAASHRLAPSLLARASGPASTRSP